MLAWRGEKFARECKMATSRDVIPASVTCWRLKGGRRLKQPRCGRSFNVGRMSMGQYFSKGGSSFKYGKAVIWEWIQGLSCFSHFRGGSEVALFCFKMAAGMYLEHYLDSKSWLKKGVMGHRVVWGVRVDRGYGFEVVVAWSSQLGKVSVGGFIRGWRRRGRGSGNRGLANVDEGRAGLSGRLRTVFWRVRGSRESIFWFCSSGSLASG